MAAVRCGRILSCALYGIQGVLVDIEVTILPGLPAFDIVGLGDSAVRESRNRVHAAIKNNGFEFPSSRITACYAPAWLRKEGSAFDLPLALAILMASGQIPTPDQPFCAFGELSLTGEIRSVPGAICRAASCRENNLTRLLAPQGNHAEILAVCPENYLPVGHLKQAVQYLIDGLANQATRLPDEFQMPIDHDNLHVEWTFPAITRVEKVNRDISTVIGQEKAVRALQIAAAGRHNLLLLGSPGCGKSTLASILPDLLPQLTLEEALQVTRIYSASGLLRDGDGLIRRRPFRMPHHSVTRSAMVGGGSIPIPGEISLAHQGVLFLDEMTEFQPEILDLLRQPMEEQVVRLVRLRHNMVYPADFMLVGAANPCRCGEYLELSSKCRCSADSVRQHLNRLSGPLLDRIDLTVELTRLSAAEMQQSVSAPAASSVQSQFFAESIKKCWQIQNQRCLSYGYPAESNARIKSTQLGECLDIPDSVIRFAAQSADRLHLTVRGYQKILRVSRTIADLEGCRIVCEDHIAEAMQYRFRQIE